MTKNMVRLDKPVRLECQPICRLYPNESEIWGRKKAREYSPDQPWGIYEKKTAFPACLSYDAYGTALHHVLHYHGIS